MCECMYVCMYVFTCLRQTRLSLVSGNAAVIGKPHMQQLRLIQIRATEKGESERVAS